MKELSLYIHIPFCVKKCDYCDFLSAPASFEVQEQYLHALGEEIKERAGQMRDYAIQTIFIGGGTPSIVPPEAIARLLKQVRSQFHIEHDAEITMEMNPGTVKTREAFDVYREAGINRLSIGLQSTFDDELRLLGRIHNYNDFSQAWSWARDAGFDNLNIDLMSALPGQTVEKYETSLRRVCELNPEHISAYSLIIEEETPFYERYHTLIEDWQNEERDREMYERTIALLQDYGYERYEISNYAKPGRECKHNLVYWNRGNYLGLGIGAASLIDNVRYKNNSKLSSYILRHGVLPYEEEERLTKEDQMSEFMFLGLRLIGGVKKSAFKKIFHCEMDEIYGDALKKSIGEGLLENDGEHVFLTERGLDLSNYVFVRFML